MKERVDWKLFGYHTTWLKNDIYAVTNITVTISIYIQIFMPLKASFFWKGIQLSIQQFNYRSKTSKIVGIRKQTLRAILQANYKIWSFFLSSLWTTCSIKKLAKVRIKMLPSSLVGMRLHFNGFPIPPSLWT